MPEITTDINSFESIDYPKNIYELLLSLQKQPIEINCNPQNSQSILENISIDEINTGRKLIYLNQLNVKVSKPLYTKLLVFDASTFSVDVSSLNIDFLHFDGIFKNVFDSFFKIPLKHTTFSNGSSELQCSNEIIDINYSKEEGFLFIQNVIQTINFSNSTLFQNNSLNGTIYLFLEYTKTTDSQTPII